jgi:DNA-binding MarR family transcriptional regulator
VAEPAALTDLLQGPGTEGLAQLNGLDHDFRHVIRPPGPGPDGPSTEGNVGRMELPDGVAAAAPDPAQPVREGHPGAGVALFRLIRHWARRGPQHSAREATGSTKNVPRILVIDAIAAAHDDAGPDAIVDVAAVARALGVVHSVASRMVSDAVQAGLVERGVAAHDTRHAALSLTPKGCELVVAARTWQDRAFEDFTRDWDEQERDTFARLLIRFTATATAR